MSGLGAARFAGVAVAAAILASALGACGGDDDDGPVQGAPVTGATGPGTTGSTGSGTTGQIGNGPASSGDRDPDAPDNSIGDRPGGPNADNSVQGNGSGGISPPAKPSPAQ